MDRLEKEKLEKRRQETSLKAMYFNRFLLIRYITAGFFFVNLYWFFSLMMSNTIWGIVPAVNLVFITIAAFEQSAMVSSPIDNAKKTILAYKEILIVNILLILALVTPLFKDLFPFLTIGIKSHCLVLGIIIIGIIFCSISLKRLDKIKNCTDKQFKYVKKYEQAIK